jgi:hypothetical protein
LRVRFPGTRQRVGPMLLQRIGGFQISHVLCMRRAFALRKGAKAVCGPAFYKEPTG